MSATASTSGPVIAADALRDIGKLPPPPLPAGEGLQLPIQSTMLIEIGTDKEPLLSAEMARASLQRRKQTNLP